MRTRGIAVLGGVVLCAWCGWASGFHTDTAAAVATWCVSLTFVVAIDVALWSRRGGDARWLTAARPWPRQGRGGRTRALSGLSPWIVLAAAATAWDVLGVDTGPRPAHLTVSALAQAFRPVGAMVLLVWMLAGIGFGVARARAPSGQAPAPDASPGVLIVLTVPRGDPHIGGSALLLPSSRPVGVGFWVVVCLAGVAMEVIGRNSEGQFATAGEALRFVSTSPIARALMVAAWLLAGYHLFAR